ncbi:hypothetical protein H8D36_06750 [archaeon]|nr:hypothetical protein [archaeon]
MIPKLKKSKKKLPVQQKKEKKKQKQKLKKKDVPRYEEDIEEDMEEDDTENQEDDSDDQEDDSDDQDDVDDEEVEEADEDPDEQQRSDFLTYEQLLLSLKDVEEQIIKQKRTIRDDTRIDGLIPENGLIALCLKRQYDVQIMKTALLEAGYDEREIDDVEDRVKKGVKEYDLWMVKTK